MLLLELLMERFIHQIRGDKNPLYNPRHQRERDHGFRVESLTFLVTRTTIGRLVFSVDLFVWLNFIKSVADFKILTPEFHHAAPL